MLRPTHGAAIKDHKKRRKLILLLASTNERNNTMLSKIIILCLTLSLRRTFAFSPTSPAFQTTLLLHASGGKGFGSSSPPKKKYNEESDRTIENPMAPPQNEMNEGQKALEALRRERAEQRDAELRKVKEIKSVDEYLTRTPNAAVIPEKVAVRMGKRMLPFVGLPLIGGMGSFVAFWYLATYRDMEFQPSMVAFTTIAILAVGLVVCSVFQWIKSVNVPFVIFMTGHSFIHSFIHSNITTFSIRNYCESRALRIVS
jgi:hypothetical protein